MLAVDDGMSNTDHSTSQATVNIYGIESGATWQYSLDSGATWVNGTGAMIDAAVFGAAGINNVLVHQTDVAGNTSSSAVLDFTLGVAPTQTATIGTVSDNVGVQQGNLTPGQSTDDTTLALTGALSDILNTGDTVVVYDGTVKLGTATMTSGTTWTYATGTLGAGTHNLMARVENTDTNLAGSYSDAFAVIKSSVTIANISDNAGTVTGTVVSGGATDDTTPTFTGTLSATLGAGEKVSIYDGATKLGEATVTGTNWNYTPAALADGAHSFSAKIESSTGTAEIASSAYSVTIVAAPVAPTQIVAITAVTDNVGVQQGGLIPGQSTDDTTLALTGTLSAGLNSGDRVVIYDGATKLANTATVTGTNWIYITNALSTGAHNLTARVENSAGLAGSSSTVFTIIENAVSITGVTDDAGTVTGIVASGGATDDTTPTLTGTLSATLGAGEKVSIYDGATKLGEASVTGTNWTFTPTALADGTHSFTAKIENSTGTAEIASSSYSITTVEAPIAPTQTVAITQVNDNVGIQQGGLTSGQSMDDQTLALSGTLSDVLNTVIGDTVVVYDGATKLGPTTVTGTSWTYTTGALSNGTHDLTARVENVAGLAGPTSMVFNVIKSSVSFISVVDDSGAVTGNVANNGATDDTTPTLTGTLGAPLVQARRSPFTTARQNSAKRRSRAQAGTSPRLLFADGAHSFTVQIESSTGIAGIASSSSYNITTVAAPIAPTQTVAITQVNDNVGVQQGGLIPGQSTDDQTLVLNGALSDVLNTGDMVVVYNGTVKLGTATVTGTSWTYTTVDSVRVVTT